MLRLPGSNWGETAAERAMALPCDPLMADPDSVYHRAVAVDAPAERLFRWLCQLRAAPYSYDWIDNRGRRSPRELTPGLEALEPGQIVMSIFELESFEPERSLTLVMRRAKRLFGDIVCTYAALPDGPGRSRLLMRMRIRHPYGAAGRAVLGGVFPPLELVMMRKQLLTLKALAERPV